MSMIFTMPSGTMATARSILNAQCPTCGSTELRLRNNGQCWLLPSHKIRRVRRNKLRTHDAAPVEYLADWCPAGLRTTDDAEKLTVPPYIHPDSRLKDWLKARRPA